MYFPVLLIIIYIFLLYLLLPLTPYRYSTFIFNDKNIFVLFIFKMAMLMFFVVNLVKMDKDSPVVFPLSSTDPLVVPSQGQCKDIHQTQTKSSTPENRTHKRTKISQGQFYFDQKH